MASGLLERIAEYAVGERSTRLPGPVIHHAKRAVVDWFAALLPGTAEPPATLLMRGLADEIGRGKARLYPSGARAPVRMAALINGTAAHTAEFDDIFRDAIYHPGAPTIAAALAAAQSRGADGDDFLRAIIVGYEISTRIGVALGAAHYKYWHTTATVGTLGAAAAVGGVLGLDAKRFAHGLATAATMAAGLQQAFRSEAMSKPLHAGHAAEAGALAALAASEGATGALDVLDGETGMGTAMSNRPDWTGAFAGLGRDYNIAAMTFKNHGCCGHSFAAIDGALALKAAHGLTPDRIAKVTVATYKTALDVTGSYKVKTPFEGKFSLPYAVASALVHGNVRIDAFKPARLADPATRDLMARVELAIDPAHNAAFPGARAATVTIETGDGRRFTRVQPTRKGDPDMPLSDDELSDKFLELATPVIGRACARKLLARLWTLERARADALLFPAAFAVRPARTRRPSSGRN
jgi:2-methylcitrate dehydratase PrpD